MCKQQLCVCVAPLLMQAYRALKAFKATPKYMPGSLYPRDQQVLYVVSIAVDCSGAVVVLSLFNFMLDCILTSAVTIIGCGGYVVFTLLCTRTLICSVSHFWCKQNLKT